MHQLYQTTFSISQKSNNQLLAGGKNEVHIYPDIAHHAGAACTEFPDWVCSGPVGVGSDSVWAKLRFGLKI